MKKEILMLLVLSVFTVTFAQENPIASDWETPALFQINREPVRATFLPFADNQRSAVVDIYEVSP